tara:strand:+ start:2943 stop:5042 length:2100 start_codon:yes stop_codon:yes gene_type:complete
MAIANYFYNETTRRYVALFGTLFNQLKIERRDNAGTLIQDMIVPLSYAPFQKVLARVNSDPDLLNSRKTAIQLPRMSFEITSLNYDPTRKVGSTQKMRKNAKAESDSSRSFMYSSVPYNLEFSLYIMTKYSEDATKIMEQIIPFFTPDWTVTAKMVPDLDAIDIPIILNSVTTEDLYEGDFETRQTVLYTLTFTLKGQYFGPERKQKVIKFIDIDMATRTTSDATAEERVTIRPGMDAQGNPLNEDAITAAAVATLTNGAVSDITVINNGENYNPNNTIAVTIAAPSSANAAITPVTTGTSITSFNITEAGGYYSTPPLISISLPSMAATTATALPVITGDSIDSISIVNSGTYYNTASVEISEAPAKSAQVKFGDDALGHASHTDQTVSHVTDYNVVTAGTGFAIEFWIYPTEFNANDSHILHYTGQTMRLEIEMNGVLVYRPALNSTPVRSTPEVLNLNEWNHCRIEHYGSTAKWLVNGIADAGGSAPQGFLFGGGATVNIGNRSANERSFLGSLDNLTFSTISGLTADGAYTVPTSALVGTLHTDDFNKVSATATATVTAGEVTSIDVINAGANYANTTPTITISAPDGSFSDAQYQATATAVLTDGAVTSVTINNSGKFYAFSNVTIGGLTSEQATATVNIGATGQATGLTVTNAGAGYRAIPVVTIAGPSATSVPYTQIEFDDDWGIITLIEDV